jgi:hypothetical protein
VTEHWPVEGHFFWYKTEIQLDNGYHLKFDLTVPGAVPELSLSTVRIGRHGGDSPGDLKFRQILFPKIGAITVAGGHVETAMKRLLILLTGESGKFSTVDKNWSELHGALSDECSRENLDSRRLGLRDVLEWGEEKRVKKRRDNAIHAYWWIFDGCGVVRSRFHRRQDGATMIGSFEDLDEDAEVLFEYARRLDGLVGEDWARAMLPMPELPHASDCRTNPY